MKAILVINEMPNFCGNCDFLEPTYAYCEAFHQKRISDDICDTEERPSWCPLKPMPEKREPKEEWLNKYHRDEFADGWNACLEEIEK